MGCPSWTKTALLKVKDFVSLSGLMLSLHYKFYTSATTCRSLTFSSPGESSSRVRKPHCQPLQSHCIALTARLDRAVALGAWVCVSVYVRARTRFRLHEHFLCQPGPTLYALRARPCLLDGVAVQCVDTLQRLERDAFLTALEDAHSAKYDRYCNLIQALPGGKHLACASRL
jgi:hypothetical protein